MGTVQKKTKIIGKDLIEEDNMPIFEFICKKCSEKFETLVLNDAERVECPKCKNGEVSKQFSVFSASSGSNCTNYDACRPKSKHKCSGGCCH
jgi:putative FmdB family regulatory protein